jgi:tripartite-type tricarboxylate transporter receptor subunit TctC
MASAPDGFAQQWPSRNVKVIVPYGVGGVTDIMARLTADRLSKSLKQTFVIENKVGAGGAIGVDAAIHSPQDGYTILFIGSTLFTVLPLAQKVNYEPLKDLVPVSITGTNGMVMVVAKDAPYSTLREFLDYAKKNPGKITYSSGGPATNNHLSTAYLAGLQSLDMVHVPYAGGQKALTAVLSKDVQMHFGNSSDLIEPVRSGTVKALAVSTKTRMPQLPDVPTVAETVPGYEYVAWNGYAVTGGVPAEVKQRLAEALKPIARDPEVIKVFSNLGIDSLGTTPKEAEASIRKDMPIYAKIVDMAGVRRK